MEKAPRLFNCARCYQQTLICGCCDRGNIYCSNACSSEARQESLKEIRQRYQNSHRGRLKNAARQARYRKRQLKKVTDQGSCLVPANDLLPLELSETVVTSTSTKTQRQCHLCGKHCGIFVRVGFMRSFSRVQTQRKTFWPLGP